MSHSNANDRRKLTGKIAVVTGGRSGIGFATRTLFLDAAAASVGPQAVTVQGDVSDPTHLDRLYDRVRTQVGHVDIVFANAGPARQSLGG